MVVEQASGGTVHVNVMVVPFSVPQRNVFPKSLLLMITVTPVLLQAGLRIASVAPVMVPMIVSPAATCQCCLLNAGPVSELLPVGLASDPAACWESMKVVWAEMPET